ncbi:hypothetical protein [Microbacterium paulum]
MGTRQGTVARADAGAAGGMTPAMKWVIGAVALVVGGGLLWATLLGAPGDESARSGSGTAGGTASPAAAAPALTPAPTPLDGSEVLPPENAQAASDRLPDLPQPTPRVTTPLPADAAAAGRLVDGFPTDLAGPTPTSDVIDSSIASDGATMQVALTARTDETPEDVAAAFQQRWTAFELAPAAAAEATLAYSDAFTSISLAASASGTGTVYTVFATLRTE